MNTMRSDLRHLLDLLVDNELSEAERRDLLGQCESQPDGWRACALAFLEAQDWSNTLGVSRPMQPLDVQPPRRAANPTDAAGTAPEQPTGPREAEPATRPASVSRPARFWSVSSAIGGLAMAASLLLAFGVGMWMNPVGGWVSPLKHDFVVGPANTERGGSAGPAARAAVGRSPQTARLVVGGSTGGNEVQVPIIEGDGLDDDWWRRQPAALPADVRRAFERMGHQVRERRQLLPFELEDGRRIMVPVDQIDVQPTDEQLYQ